MKILICGATGFIGRNLVESLSTTSGIEITAVFNKKPPFFINNVDFVQANLTPRATIFCKSIETFL